MARRKSNTAKEKVNAREREMKAFELRKQGLSYVAIGKKLGVTDAAAWYMVDRVLKQFREKTKENVEAVREMEVARLDALIDAHWKRATAKTGKHIVSSTDMVLKIMARRSKLLGLDAPMISALTGADGGPIKTENGLSKEVVDTIRRDVLGIPDKDEE